MFLFFLLKRLNVLRYIQNWTVCTVTLLLIGYRGFLCWGTGLVSRSADDTFNNMHQVDSVCHRIKLATHSTRLTRLQNRSLFWHPELSPFLSSVSLLVIIALTLNVREINQNDFFKVNGCKESKRGRKKIAMLSLCPLCMKGKDELKCRELVHWFTPATHLLKPSQRRRRVDRAMS